MKGIYLYCITIGILLVVVFCTLNKNKQERYSGFRSTGKKDKNKCISHYISHYNNCVENSGGVDVLGNCRSLIESRLVECNY